MTPLPCDRPYRHNAHDYVDATGADRRCPGRHSQVSLPKLLAARPELAGVGLSVIHELKVMSA